MEVHFAILSGVAEVSLSQKTKSVWRSILCEDVSKVVKGGC
ncbi:hypothetical protein Pint_07353 [Pistacia integerrima]|uniref:Uncharacterized protein n=1 Tax=Pistacia integerrima TaxID=434235 RepID=A0ACC0XUB8_9ROSI|nr:hypothetical protein Pint_07353 [Pistacia integerrima]